MALKPLYDKIDDIPEEYRELYTEKNGKFEFTGVERHSFSNVKTLEDTLATERRQHKTINKELQDKLKKWEELGEVDEVVAKIDSIPELEAKATNKIDEKKIEELVEIRVKREKATIERDLTKVKTESAEKDKKIQEFVAKDTRRAIKDAVFEAATKLKVIPSAIEDIIINAERVFTVAEDGKVFTKEASGVTPSVAPDVWLSEMQERRPHWWPASSGSGASGGGGGNGFPGNPWSKKDWSITKQGQVIEKQGQEKAEQMARAAGVTVDAVAPAEKG